MIVFETCNGYKAIGTASDTVDAPALCEHYERERNDGYAVIAVREGSIVAFADGWVDRWNPDREAAAKYDAACGYTD